jgi:protein SCO1/2
MKTRSAAVRRQIEGRRALVLGGGGAAAILLMAAAVLWATSPAGTRQGGGLGGPFRLVADDGRTVTERSFPGKYLAIYFGYTSCRDVCPATLNTLTAALGRLGESARLVQPLFITVDPVHDTPAVLRNYVAHFSPVLLGLTGSAAEIGQVAREYGIVAISHGQAVDHSSVILLFGPDGALIAPIPADASEMVVAQALARYVS